MTKKKEVKKNKKKVIKKKTAKKKKGGYYAYGDNQDNIREDGFTWYGRYINE